MAAVNLLMANRAILIAARSQVMKCRRHNADHAGSSWPLLRKICVTFEADEADISSRQHFRICRSVGFMTSLATLGPHGNVFIGKRAPKIAMAFETTGLVRSECANLPLREAAMRIVAVHAGHGGLRKPVRVRALE